MALHNRVSQKELKEKLLLETEPRITLSFYRYFTISDPLSFRDELYKTLQHLNVFGRIYVAAEGINAQVSVPVSNEGAFRTALQNTHGLNDLRLNNAIDDDGKSFWVLKVKVRDRIVSDGIDDPDFNMGLKGKYVNAKQFNQLAHDPDTVIIDMRNHYEYEVGHFVNAIEIPSDTFREQLPMAAAMMEKNKDKNIIMYCTGGIRCEKASAYMLHHGFTNVYHLEGGIINYAKEVKEDNLENNFIGKNFVFDDRLGERITEDVIAKCHQCGEASDNHTNCKNDGCHLLFIQCNACAEKFEGCCSTDCQDVLHMTIDDQKKVRAGTDKGSNIFNKSKARVRPKLNNEQLSI